MKKFALLIVLALELAVCGCAHNTPSSEVNTTTSGNWEARLSGGTGQASQLNFVTSFTLLDSGPLSNIFFSFFNSGPCFGTAVGDTTESGNATLNVSSTDTVTGSLNFTVTSTQNGNVLTLTSPDGGLTGTSNGSPGTTGVLSNGVAVGTWTLTSSDTKCVPSGGSVSGSFLMCQGNDTCVAP